MSKRKSAQQKREMFATAMHEAGHVVMGLLDGRRLVSVSIVPEDLGNYGTSSGRTEWEPISGSINLYELVKLHLAGPMAEELHTASPCDDGGRVDVAFIYAITWMYLISSARFQPHARFLPHLTKIYMESPAKIPPLIKQTADRQMATVRPVVKETLEQHWDDVEKVAQLLVKHKQVKPEMIAKVLTHTTP